MICNWSNTHCRIRKICTQLKYVRMSVLFYWSIIDNFGKVQMSTFFGCIFCLRVSLQHRPWCMSQSELALHSSPNWPDPGTGSWHMLSVHVYPTSQSVSYPHVSPDFFPHIGRHVPVTMEEIGTFAATQSCFVTYHHDLHQHRQFHHNSVHSWYNFFCDMGLCMLNYGIFEAKNWPFLPS